MARALLLANRDDADPGLVGAALGARGFHLSLLAREDAETTWPDDPTAGADLVLVLGSDWSVYWADVGGAVSREREVLAAAVAAGTPVLAICFGAQVLAAALGGEVSPASRTELGWLDVEPLDDVIAPGPWFQFHGDTFTLPPGATLLARSDVGPQAFTIGSALAVQFHPEVTPAIVERWATSDPEPVARAGFTTADLVERTRAEQPRAEEAARQLVDAFLATTPP